MLTFNMSNVVVVEGTAQVEQSVTRGHVRQERVSESLAFRSALDESGNVGDVQEGWNL